MAIGLFMSEKKKNFIHIGLKQGVFFTLAWHWVFVYNHVYSSSLRPGSGILSRNMVGEVYFCYICFTKLNFSLIRKLNVLPLVNILF